MTIQELYEWAKQNNATELEIRRFYQAWSGASPEYWEANEPQIEKVDGKNVVVI